MERLEETLFLGGTLRVFQPKRGFRFSIDSVLLAHFVELKKEEKALEIGAGTGVIGFILLKRYPNNKLFFLEIEPLYIEALSRGVKANLLEERAYILKGNALFPPFKREVFDVILANPPYFKKESGRKSREAIENLARREEVFKLESFLKACANLLKNKGRLYLIFTAFRLGELIYTLKTFQLEPKRLRLIHPYPGEEANLLLLKAMKGAKEGIRILPPLYIYQGKGKDYTTEVKNYLQPISN